MKKILIIQLDSSYFLFETLQVLERHLHTLKDFEITLLGTTDSIESIQDGSAPIFPGLTDDQKVLNHEYDMSFNLSLNESSWPIHAKVNATRKSGPYLINDQLIVPDLWSSFYLTHKARTPFMPFHLRDIFKNILGLKRYEAPAKKKTPPKRVAIGSMHPEVFPAEEQEKLIHYINQHHPHLQLMDVSEIDPVSDLTNVIYIGPTSLNALKICEENTISFFLGSHFQGFNLLTAEEGHLYISSRGKQFNARDLCQIIDQGLKDGVLPTDSPYSIYTIEEEHLFGSYLKSLNSSDDNYPFYQAHVVLWNFVLNLFDVNLEISKCSENQIVLLKQNQLVLEKLIRLYDYAMSSLDTIHAQAKTNQADNGTVQGHLKNLREIAGISDQISQSHSYLRPFLDYYHIRRGQNQGNTLLAQAQDTFLVYTEEHQVLKALSELFTVTLGRNEVNI